jgi:membrane protease YdiL (CAAX protease family)
LAFDPGEVDVIGIVAALVLSLVGVTVAFYPGLSGSPWVWVSLGGSQLPIAAYSLKNIIKNNELQDRLGPRWGDISLGMGSALLLFAASWMGRTVMAPNGSARTQWLARAYAQLGASDALEKHWMLVLVGVCIIAIIEELGWRGWVLPMLEQRHGTRLAWPLTGLLYAVAFLPTVWWLRSDSGPNPFVVGAALLCGCTWSYLAAKTQRLLPSILSHAVFVWFIVLQFRMLNLDK